MIKEKIEELSAEQLRISKQFNDLKDRIEKFKSQSELSVCMLNDISKEISKIKPVIVDFLNEDGKELKEEYKNEEGKNLAYEMIATTLLHIHNSIFQKLNNFAQDYSEDCKKIDEKWNESNKIMKELVLLFNLTSALSLIPEEEK